MDLLTASADSLRNPSKGHHHHPVGGASRFVSTQFIGSGWRLQLYPKRSTDLGPLTLRVGVGDIWEPPGRVREIAGHLQVL